MHTRVAWQMEKKKVLACCKLKSTYTRESGVQTRSVVVAACM